MIAPRESAGVDFRQWRALLRAHALTDYARLLGHDGPAAALRAAGGIALLFVIGGLASVGATAIVWLAPDVFFAASAMTAVTMLVVGMFALSRAVELVGPDDFEIVGFRPISSRTYFAARAAALLFGTLESAVPIGWLPVLAWCARKDGSFWLAAAAAAGIAISSCVVTFAFAAAFGLLLRVVSAKKLTRVVLTAQTLGFIFLFTAYWLPFAGQRVTLSSIAAITLPSTASVLLFPGTWFGSYVALAAGHGGAWVWWAAALSVAAVVVTAWAIVGPLSERYTAALGEQASEAAPARPTSRMRLPRLRAERRAVLILLATQLRANLAVQASVLSGLLMVAVMGGVFFMQGAGDAGFALLFGPLNEWTGLQRSSEHEAAWPFFTSPCSRALAVTTARDAVALCVLAPLLLLFLWLQMSAGSGVHALGSLAAGGIGSYLSLQLSVLANPALPFSLPLVGRQARVFVNIGATFGGAVLMLVIRPALVSRVGTVLVLVGTALAAAAINKATYWRIQRLERR